MPLCANSCSVSPPAWTSACNVQTTPGGIPFLIFAACNFRFDATITKADGTTVAIGAITDPESWRIAVHNRLIARSPEGYGEKASSTFTVERVIACSPETIASKTHVLNFISKDTDAVNFLDVTFWDDIELNYGQYRLMYQACNEVIHYTGEISDPGFNWVPTQLGYIKPNNNQENDFWEANVSWQYRGAIKRIEVIGIDSAFVEDIVGT